MFSGAKNGALTQIRSACQAGDHAADHGFLLTGGHGHAKGLEQQPVVGLTRRRLQPLREDPHCILALDLHMPSAPKTTLAIAEAGDWEGCMIAQVYQFGVILPPHLVATDESFWKRGARSEAELLRFRGGNSRWHPAQKRLLGV